MILLNETEEDVLKELFNLSFGKTAATLSEMVDAEIALSLPCFFTLSRGAVVEHIHSLYGEAIGLVGMRYRFLFSPGQTIPGMAILLIRAAEIAHFLDALYGTHIPEEMANRVEEEAMQLTGDLLLYTCTSSLSTLFSSEIEGEKPHYYRGGPEGLSAYLSLSDPPLTPVEESADPAAQLLLLRVDFSLVGKEVAGSLLTWLEGAHLPTLKKEITRFMAAYLD
ncbi:MAG: hypothetical protein H7836_05410 [Magnetococcus sp. YQC-3]